MTSQQVPQVKPEDIDRIVRRDFPESEFDIVLDILHEYGSEKWHREGWRVEAAVLKLAKGKLPALRKAVEAAKRDYRDALLAAEYPEYRRRRTPAEKLEGSERDQVINSDWNQYEAWLKRP